MEKVECYRDLGDDTWLNWLERYFIGGKHKIQMDQFHGISTENNKLNRYGNCTQSTGYLNISRNAIIQKNIDEIETNQMIMEHRERKCQKLPTISSILMAYHRARDKLESYADINEM